MAMQLLDRIRSSRSGRRQLLQDMKKVVYKLDISDITAKQKAMKAVSTLQGVDFISIDMNAKTLTVIGLVDPVDVVSKLRKAWPADIVSVGPAKEPEPPKEEAAAKEEPKKEDAKEEAKEEPKKEGKAEEGKEGEAKKEEGKKEEDGKKKEAAPEETIKGYNYRVFTNYPPPNYHMSANHFHAHSIEENPNACVIC